MYDHVTAVSQAMNEADWGNYASEHEEGNAQYEHNFGPADALTTADRVTTSHYLITAPAERGGGQLIQTQQRLYLA